MIKRNGSYEVQVREKMRGGKGSVKVEQFWKPEEMTAKSRLFAKLTLEPGASIGYHDHPAEDEVYLVLRGRGVVTDSGVATEVGPGDTVLTGNGGGHSVEAIGSEPLEILAVIMLYG